MASLLASFGHALAGIGALFARQRNARLHLAAAGLAIGLALWLDLSGFEWALLVLTIGLVLAAEGLNTAIEAVVDLVSPAPHPLARLAKDTAAGAVLLLALAAVGVALLLFGPRLLQRLGL